MSCLGYVIDEKLYKEAATYGTVGSRPQIVYIRNFIT